MWQTAGAQQGILSLLIISFWYSLGPFLLDLQGVFWFMFWEYIYLLIFHLCKCSETLESFPWMSHQLTFGAFLFILGAGLWMSSNVIYQRQSVICMLDSALLCSALSSSLETAWSWHTFIISRSSPWWIISTIPLQSSLPLWIYINHLRKYFFLRVPQGPMSHGHFTNEHLNSYSPISFILPIKD